MVGPEKTCKKCGHKCHCYTPNCRECINDVCGVCDCEEKKQESDARNWDNYLK